MLSTAWSHDLLRVGVKTADVLRLLTRAVPNRAPSGTPTVREGSTSVFT